MYFYIGLAIDGDVPVQHHMYAEFLQVLQLADMPMPLCEQGTRSCKKQPLKSMSCHY